MALPHTLGRLRVSLVDLVRLRLRYRPQNCLLINKVTWLVARCIGLLWYSHRNYFYN